MDKVIFFNNFIFIKYNLFNLGISLFNSNDFLFDSWDIKNLLLNNWDFNGSISESLDKAVDFHNDWPFNNKFHNLRDLNNFFIQSFDFVYFWDFIGNTDYFFNEGWYLLNDILLDMVDYYFFGI